MQLSIVTPSAPVIMTRLPPPSAILAAAVHSNRIVARAIIEDRPAPNQLLGLTAVIAACLSSGFASTYFERVLKTPSTYRGSTTISPPPSIWIRNIQLSIFGLAAGIPIVFYEMSVSGTGLGKAVAGGNWWEGFSWGATRGSVGFFYGQFFQGFNALTWAVVFLQVTGGLLGGQFSLFRRWIRTDVLGTALVMQHADNISKCFSTSLSILLSFAASMYLFGFQVRPPSFSSTRTDIARCTVDSRSSARFDASPPLHIRVHATDDGVEKKVWWREFGKLYGSEVVELVVNIISITSCLHFVVAPSASGTVRTKE